VQNVIRHAGNATCTISLDVLGGEIAIEVHDDGPGFAVGDTPRGMGLEIMQDRLDALDGRLAVHSAPAGGTTVELHLPARAVEMSTP
jgi:signal transduction histidine kinase